MAARSNRNGAAAPDHASLPKQLEHLGPLTELGREATGIRTHQEAVRRASDKTASSGGAAVVRSADLEQAPATRRRAEAAKHIDLGARLLASGKPAQAIAAFRQAILLDPENPGSHNDLGLALFRCSRIADAISSFREAIALKEGFASAHYNLGLAMEENRAEPGAITAYRRAAALAPNNVEAHERLGYLLGRHGHVTEALESFERAFAAKPTSTSGRLSRAEALRIQGHLEEAETWFRRALAGDPRNIYVLRPSAIFLNQSGRLEDAAHWFNRALALDPADVYAFYGLTNARKMTPADRPLLARMSARLEAPPAKGVLQRRAKIRPRPEPVASRRSRGRYGRTRGSRRVVRVEGD